MKRVFFSWDQPFLPQMIERTVLQKVSGKILDLHSSLFLFPTSRSGRRFLELLVEQAEVSSWEFIPPQIMTLGSFIDFCTPSDKRLASQEERLYAWTQVFHQTSSEDLQRIFPHHRTPDSPIEWLALSETIDALHRELSRGLLRFADVALTTEQTMIDIPERWQALALLSDRYYNILRETNLIDAAPHFISEFSPPSLSPDSEIFLAGLSDISPIYRRLFELFHTNVTSLIYAPDDCKDLFDDLGSIQAKAWTEKEISLPDERIFIQHSYDGIAKEVLERLSAVSPLEMNHVTIGITDEALQPVLALRFGEAEVPTHDPEGRSLRFSPPAQFLISLAEHLAKPSFYRAASLIRHPSVLLFMERHSSFSEQLILTELDRFFNTKYPSNVPTPDQLSEFAVVSEVFAQLQTFIEPLQEAPQPLVEWVEPIEKILKEIFGGTLLDTRIFDQRIIVESCLALFETLSSFLQRSIAPFDRVSAASALQFLLHQAGSMRIATESEKESLEMLGWLELSLDDAPFLYVAGFHEGKIPESHSVNPFLSDHLRGTLRLPNQEHRLGRDAYILSSLFGEWRTTSLFLSTKDEEGNPILPSRLLYQCDQETVQARVDRIFDRSGEGLSATSLEDQNSLFHFPLLPQAFLPPPKKLSVTSLRTYLECPYLFYLQHVARLRVLHDHDRELSPPAIGTLIHSVLQKFGDAPEADTIDSRLIESFLFDTLHSESLERFGTNILASVRVQLRFIQDRLSKFALWQSDSRREGWKIWKTEIPFLEEDLFGIPFYPCTISGTIDRIDRNESGDHWRIIDYKTNESGKGAMNEHIRASEWVDLQLPLYHHLVQRMASTNQRPPPTISLFLLSLFPRGRSLPVLSEASFTAEQLAEAWEVARNCVEQIGQGIFHPKEDTIPSSRDYSIIYGGTRA